MADNLADILGGGGGDSPKPFKMPTMEDFQKFVDKMEVSDEEKEDLLRMFMKSKDQMFTPDFDPTKTAREAMRRTFFQPGGFAGPSYVYFLLTIGIIVALLGVFVWRLFKYLQSKEKPLMSREEKKRALKTEKKLQKKGSSGGVSKGSTASPKAKSNQSSPTTTAKNGSSSIGNGKKSK